MVSHREDGSTTIITRLVYLVSTFSCAFIIFLNTMNGFEERRQDVVLFPAGHAIPPLRAAHGSSPWQAEIGSPALTMYEYPIAIVQLTDIGAS